MFNQKVLPESAHCVAETKLESYNPLNFIDNSVSQGPGWSLLICDNPSAAGVIAIRSYISKRLYYASTA